LAGAIDDTFSAGFVASMAVFNSSVVLSRPLDLWDSVFMVEIRGCGERTVRREGGGEDS